MMFLDTNVIIDLLRTDEAVGGEWSRRLHRDAVGATFLCNLVVLAELSGKANNADALVDTLSSLDITVAEMSIEAAYRSGTAFQIYRSNGGRREAILADFLIGGHAEALGATLVTRDRRLASYFPNLNLITPESHP